MKLLAWLGVPVRWAEPGVTRATGEMIGEPLPGLGPPLAKHGLVVGPGTSGSSL
jgi:hypothetical protein